MVGSTTGGASSTKRSPSKKEERRLVKQLSTIDEFKRQEIRRAVEKVSAKAFQVASNNGCIENYPISVKVSEGTAIDCIPDDSPLLDLPHDSSSSVSSSHVRAIRRGSELGLGESNEAGLLRNRDTNSLSDESSFGQFDTPTVAETKMSSVTEMTGILKSKKRRTSGSKKWKRLLTKRNGRQKSFLTSEIANEAWMCGVCAKAFSSLEAAERHEDYHIQEVVMDLGWAGENNQNTSFLVTPSAVTAPVEPLDFDENTRPGLSMGRPALFLSDRALSPTADADFQTTTQTMPSQNHPRVHFQGHDETITSLRDAKHTPHEHHPADMVMPDSLLRRRRFGGDDEHHHHQQQQQQQINRFSYPDYEYSGDHDLLLPRGLKNYVVLADEALSDVCNKAKKYILTNTETDAELELEWLAKDKAHYDMLANRNMQRQSCSGKFYRMRAENKTILSKVQNKFVDAYQLMKEGPTGTGGGVIHDHYNRKVKGDSDKTVMITHDDNTLYLNVIVKNSIQVVSHELERLAKQRWEDMQGPSDDKDATTKSEDANSTGTAANKFQKFRAAAQGNLVKLAGLALASDFTPRRIAIQLSNDLYRLLTPRLKRRGVAIETEIEYRVGPYFVLAVNIKSIDWSRLVKVTNREVLERNLKWSAKRRREKKKMNDSRQAGVVMSFITLCLQMSRLTKYDVLAQTLAWLHYLHWSIHIPICFLLYHVFLGTTFRTFILSSVADEIFFYVEEKGMEMEVNIREAATQAAFMLSALRELRAGDRENKKKRKESESSSKGTLLGPLLGPAIKEDKDPAPPVPEGFVMPDNYEFVGLDLDLPVGFRRLRWAFLHSKSQFFTEAIFRAEANYVDITTNPWNKHDERIGSATLPDDVNQRDFEGAEKEQSYLMPKSAFVKANMCYETCYVEMYNDYCFCLKKKAYNPDVPYGSTFLAWTKYIVLNTGADSCKLICSVEAEFPNGPPLISRQIKSGMRAGVFELFVLIGETISKYAQEFP